MDSPAQLTIAGSPQSAIPDLRDISLVELAALATDGDAAIHAVVARMIDGMESPSLVQAMIFNSAI